MKKTMSIIAIFAVFLVSVAAYSDKAVDASQGYTAPVFTIGQGENKMSLDQMKGKYVLLTFWASSDAKSRIACQQYSSFTRENQQEDEFCHISVNFDRSEALFNEIVKRDKLQAKTQYFAQGDKASRLMADYQLENGFNTYLIDPQGRIVAKNPSTQHLNEILSN